MSWPTTADGQYYHFEGIVDIPVDPTTGVAVLLLRPQGGSAGEGVPAIEDGAPGVHAELSEEINFTELAHDDPTPASASFTTLTPPTTSTPGVYKLNLALHGGEPGDDGTTSIDVDSVDGTAAAGKMIRVNSAVDGFEYTSEGIVDRWIPTTINNTATGNPSSTLATVSIPSNTYDFDWRPIVHAQTIVTPDGSNVSVDLVARLNGETGGNIVGRCFGIGGVKERLTITSAPPPGSAAGYDKVLANAAATIYLRTERQTGSNTYTTSASTTLFSVQVMRVG